MAAVAKLAAAAKAVLNPEPIVAAREDYERKLGAALVQASDARHRASNARFRAEGVGVTRPEAEGRMREAVAEMARGCPPVTVQLGKPREMADSLVMRLGRLSPLEIVAALAPEQIVARLMRDLDDQAEAGGGWSTVEPGEREVALERARAEEAAAEQD